MKFTKTQGAERAGSIWLDETAVTAFDRLEDDVTVDTVIVGGGIAGISTGHNLVEAGQSVAILDRERIVAGVTGHTTAKLTSQHGLIYDELIDTLGEEAARQYAAANEAAIDEIETRVDELEIDADVVRTPAYTYTHSIGLVGRFRDEVEAARRLDLPASFTTSTPLPFDIEAAVRFDDQASFNPREYLLALAQGISDRGNHIFEQTPAVDIEPGEPCRVITKQGTVTATDVVVATNFPFFDPALFFTRLIPKRSYVLAARLGGDVPEGMHFRWGDPYFSVRPRPTGDESLVLIGGQNHQTGHGGSTLERYRLLERETRARFEVASIEARWSTQDFVSIDRVPFVGKLAPHLAHVYVATGFGGWGLTTGTVAGRILTERILGRDSPWSDVFGPSRLRVGASSRAFLEHNATAMGRFVGDHLRDPPTAGAHQLDRGDGRVVTIDGESVAIARDEAGEVHAVSAKCPHMGCFVTWNDAEQSWDCPCHGSRFDADGTVLHTPAVEDLRPFDEADIPNLSHDST